jgi:replicative DNA helicase
VTGPVNGDPYPVWQKDWDYYGAVPQLAEVNDMTCRDALVWYHQHLLGYHVRPMEIIPNRGRKLVWPKFGYQFDTLEPPTDEEINWFLANWQDEWQLGMVMGKGSGLFAYDIDDMAQWRQFQAKHEIGPTAVQVTGRDGGGLTLVYRRSDDAYDEHHIRQGQWSWEYSKIEVKSKAPVTVAPSVHHETGRKYQWLTDGPGYPEEVPAGLLRAREHQLLEERARQHLFEEIARRAARKRADILEQRDVLADVPEQPGQLLADFLADGAEEAEMEIPALVPKKTRVIFTGEEGVGKSTLNRYIGFCHAAGIHPFTAEPYEGGSTVVIDCENPKNLGQMRFAELAEALGPEAAEQARQRLVVDSLPGGIDLASPYWQEYLLRLAGAWKPTLLVIGPLYKLCAAHLPKSEEFFIAISLFLDRLREEYGCSMWIEAHCRQSSPGFSRDIVPYGNSGWRRWPETGMHLGRSGVLTDWRGNRYADQVSWPVRLSRVPGSRVLWRAEALAGGGAETETEKFQAIRGAVSEDPGISLTKLRLAVGDDGTGIRKAVKAGAITEYRAGPGKPNRYEVNQLWSGDTEPAPEGSFRRWFEMADFGPGHDPED